MLITEAALAGEARALQAECPVIEHLVVIASPAAAKLTGQAISLNGGISAA